MTTSAPAPAPVTIRDRVKELRRVQARALNAPPIDPDAEVWLPVVGFEGVYEVSNEGRVRRIAAQVGRRGLPPGSVIREHLNRQNGYVYVTLNNRGQVEKAVHRLVAEAWCGRGEGAQEVDHLDGDRTNRRASNLEWVTTSENMRRCGARGLRSGENHYGAKVTAAQVVEIRALRARGVPYRRVARMYGVTVGCIQGIAEGKSWKGGARGASA